MMACTEACIVGKIKYGSKEIHFLDICVSESSQLARLRYFVFSIWTDGEIYNIYRNILEYIGNFIYRIYKNIYTVYAKITVWICLTVLPEAGVFLS